MRISDWSSDVCSADLINLSPGGFWSHRFWPISVHPTRWEAEFHVPKPLTGRAKLQQELYITRIAEILLESVTNTERTQRGIATGAYDTTQLQAGEVQIRPNPHHLRPWVNARTVRTAIAN